MRKRLDIILLEKGLAESREKARHLIMAGMVKVGGHPATKPGHLFDDILEFEVESPPRFVSRGGEKLDAALEAFAISVASLRCLDVGASTGGFTDCLLQRGASEVAAVDVGRGQLHQKIRLDSRVAVLEQFNARNLSLEDLPWPPEFAVVDVSFISLRLILPRLVIVLRPGSQAVTLIKPQFEAGPADVGRGGVVRDPAIWERVCGEVRRAGESFGLEWLGLMESPLRGPAGNVEFLAWWRLP